MPRNGQGGARQGDPTKAYTNRTDLNSGGTAGFMRAGVRPYGEPEAPPTPEPPPTAGGPDAPAPAPSLERGPPPEMFSPTTRPDEPITAGMPFGPGAGPTDSRLIPEGGLAMNVRAMMVEYPEIADNPDVVALYQSLMRDA